LGILRSSSTVLIRPLATVVLCAWAASIAQAAESIWEAARMSGSVVVLRHSFAPGGFDPPDARLDDCATQRNLDERGRAQARRIGEAFRQNGVAVGAVLSSPRCRCLDTARLAFGQAQPWDVLQGALNDTELRRRQVAAIKRAITGHRSGPALVL
jgi:phosphohistidine phosphatase SixA